MNTELFTKPAASALSRMIDNKHTAVSGLLVLTAFSLPQLAYPLANIWAPGHGQQVKDTLDVLQKWVDGLAVPYGLLMSGNKQPITTDEHGYEN